MIEHQRVFQWHPNFHELTHSKRIKDDQSLFKEGATMLIADPDTAVLQNQGYELKLQNRH